MSAGRTTRFTLVAALLLVAAAFFLPELWLFALSLKTKAGVYEYPPRLLSPGSSAANYLFVFTQTQVPWYLWNSARVAALGDRDHDADRRPGRVRAVARAVHTARRGC